MHHITDYRIITDPDAGALSKQVEEAIHVGWQPFGGLVVIETDDGAGTSYAQPVVKYAEWFR